MKNTITKIGLASALSMSLAGGFSVGAAQADYPEDVVRSAFSQSGKVCKVTRRGGADIYVAAADKYFRIRRGGTMIVVDPQPRQGIIVVKAMINRKMTQGEIKLDETNCVPVLPR